jgi:hypothetical protein|tara:strand:- start:296 stop:523 length:228 start_codon:yes stop_codon:yes gene_type:complete
VSSAQQAYKFDQNNVNLAKPYNREMFSSGKGGLGKGISSLAGIGEENRKLEGSGYAEDYSAVFEYNNLLKQLKEQ